MFYNKLWLFILIMFGINFNYSNTILLLDFYDGEGWADCAITPKDGNILTYSSFSLLDKKFSTAAVVNAKVHVGKPIENKGYPYFAIIFTENYPVDKIVIYNGYQKNILTYSNNNRVKEMFIVATHIKSNQIISETIYSNYILKDIPDRQEIVFNETIIAKEWLFFILSTYPGTKYDDTCISEIEFWYKGKRYEIANLEEAKKEFLNSLRKKVRSIVTGYAIPYADSGMLEMEPIILVPIDELRERWRRLGVDVDKIDMERYDIEKDEGIYKVGSYTMCLINFVGKEREGGKKTKGFEGKIIAGAKKGFGKKYKVVEDYINAIEIGEWKIDKNANLWIKIGNGEWKRAKKEDYRISTKDTDIGEILHFY